MVVDNASHTVFLFGGWDGSRDLADFGTYLPRALAEVEPGVAGHGVGGPMPRSCHKMVINPVYRQVMMIIMMMMIIMTTGRSSCWACTWRAA